MTCSRSTSTSHCWRTISSTSSPTLITCRELNRLFDPHRVPDRLDEHIFYGDFVLDADAGVKNVAEAYGLPLANAREDETVAQYLVRLFHKRPVIGDRAPLGKAEFVVRDIEGGRITKVGLRIRSS